ncbi:hypothetical protein H1P_960010 [Hyella patelloides LEGE 07179]|uniref:Uncharacterized protein n=1 Tax=Hyella patelloides LEGE 07179 TaxID=945734 RepID=A0A563W5D5_9CYAN|nr:hypothetical protein H1P_960010 [Hyella patelloides LEGE 07179]
MKIGKVSITKYKYTNDFVYLITIFYLIKPAYLLAICLNWDL